MAATRPAKRLCADINVAVIRQSSAHSKQHRGQSLWLFIPAICVRQSVQLSAHIWQALIAAA
jgi:hypothetical protein